MVKKKKKKKLVRYEQGYFVSEEKVSWVTKTCCVISDVSLYLRSLLPRNFYGEKEQVWPGKIVRSYQPRFVISEFVINGVYCISC